MYLAAILNSMIDWLCLGNRWIILSRTKTTGWWRISSRTAKTGQDVCTISFKSIITGHVRRLLGGAMGAPSPLPLYWHHVNLPSTLEFSIWICNVPNINLLLFSFVPACTLSQRYVSNLMCEIWIPLRVFRLFLSIYITLYFCNLTFCVHCNNVQLSSITMVNFFDQLFFCCEQMFCPWVRCKISLILEEK